MNCFYNFCPVQCSFNCIIQNLFFPLCVYNFLYFKLILSNFNLCKIVYFFQEATKALVHSLYHLQGDLKNVEGLVEVKEILEAKKEVELNYVIFEDPYSLFFGKSISEADNLYLFLTF